MKNLLVVISAIKKNAIIPDQLVKKLNGVTLIQRAINMAFELTNNILVITDSEEIALICDRNSVMVYKDKDLRFNSDDILQKVIDIIKPYDGEHILLYCANTPLVDGGILKNAYAVFKKDTSKVLTSVKLKNKGIFFIKNKILTKMEKDIYYIELKAFYIFSKSNFHSMEFLPYVIENEKSIEIEGYQDWWVCEKVLQRKRIIFNVIGDSKIGTGHIHRSLTIAKEISDHEIIFVCNDKYKLAVDSIALRDYMVIATKNVAQTIIDLKPNLIINDCLNTDSKMIKKFKDYGVKVVNFEDLGSGSKYADLVFNELFEIPQLEGKNYFWGHNYTLLRDEFDAANAHTKPSIISEILLTFGGSDPNNLTMIALKAILNTCKKHNIRINIVCGSGYLFADELKCFINKSGYENINLILSSTTISKIMERCQFAISSNGRTIYELADMHIPAIVVSHHDREATHTFATTHRGFINLGVFDQKIQDKIEEKFRKIIEDADYVELLFENISRYNFRNNTKKVINKILELI
ncbi:MULTISPECIES: hypothetical protein [unclassified Campylobacter]|uniref:hypothetical protein n=1 Tax=unclassified Campylobacter TaxID=2593542 RepID=UPI003D33BF36